MRIAQIAPLYESVPPLLYGGTERVVANLTETLVELGHEVTLYASGDSTVCARLVGQCERALRLEPRCVDAFARHAVMIERIWQDCTQFDIIHSHVDYMLYSLARRCPVPIVTTLHGRLDIHDLEPLYREFDDIPLVSISESQRTPFPWARWMGTVYHGLREERFAWTAEPGSYLAFLGRISPEKRVDSAIEIAIRSETPLKIAAKVDRADRDYYEGTIRPLLNHPLVDYIGEISEEEKIGFLGNALALLFPIDWPEPFGLAMIEAMACGTPVIARRRGSVPEVIDDGLTGFIFETIDEGVEAVRRIRSVDRRECRSQFERRFSSRRMTQEYLKIYERVFEQAAAGTLEEIDSRG